MIKKPLIGITFDSEAPGGYAKYPWYALRANYCTSVAEAGSIPFPLIHDLNLIEDYLSLIDGLLVTGGDHDIDPKIYGDSTCHPTVKTKPQRTGFEIEIVKKALEKNMPVLGICGGHQVINVALGGTLIQHIPQEIPECLQHERQPRHEVAHPIKIKEGTLLFKIIGALQMEVNSGHHQAIKQMAPNAIANAFAPDGIIEGMESLTHRFCLGLQWHPEFTITPADAAIFKALTEEARG